MKRIIATILATTMVFSTPHVAMAKSHNKSYRTEFAVCYDISVKDNITYITTGDGNCYIFECDDSDIGDIYRITFDTRNTKSVKDDRIVKIRYINTIDNVNNIFDMRAVK